MTRFGTVTQVGKSMFIVDQSRPVLKGRGPGIPKFVGPPTCAHTVGETITKFCMVIKLVEGIVLQVLPRPCPGQFFITRMLTRDLFAVANSIVFS